MSFHPNANWFHENTYFHELDQVDATLNMDSAGFLKERFHFHCNPVIRFVQGILVIPKMGHSVISNDNRSFILSPALTCMECPLLAPLHSLYWVICLKLSIATLFLLSCSLVYNHCLKVRSENRMTREVILTKEPLLYCFTDWSA